jgi:hypothetical protein
MNDRTRAAVRQRLADKALDHPEVLVSYLNEDIRDQIVRYAFELTDWATIHPRHIGAYEVIEDWKHDALEQYIGDYYESELAEYRVELAENEADYRRDQVMDERAERIAEERERQAT